MFDQVSVLVFETCKLEVCIFRFEEEFQNGISVIHCFCTLYHTRVCYYYYHYCHYYYYYYDDIQKTEIDQHQI